MARAETVETTSAGERASVLMRAVNTHLRSLSADLDRTEPVGFFCECRLPACFAVLWMTTAEFDAVVAAGQTWIVRAGHPPRGRPRGRRSLHRSPAAQEQPSAVS